MALWIIAFLLFPVMWSERWLTLSFLCIVIAFGWWSAAVPAGRETSRVPYLVCRKVWMKELASYLDGEALKGALPAATKARLSKVHRAVEKKDHAPHKMPCWLELMKAGEREENWWDWLQMGSWEVDDHHFSTMEKCFPTLGHSSRMYASTQMDCRHRLYQTEAANHRLALNRRNKMATDARHCLFMPQMWRISCCSLSRLQTTWRSTAAWASWRRGGSSGRSCRRWSTVTTATSSTGTWRRRTCCWTDTWTSRLQVQPSEV